MLAPTPTLVSLLVTLSFLLIGCDGGSKNNELQKIDAGGDNSPGNSASSSGFTGSSSNSSSSSSSSSSTSSSSGSSSSSSSSGIMANEVSELGWDLYAQPGVWRTRVTAGLPTDVAQSGMAFVKVAAIESINATTIRGTECEGRESETITRDAYIHEDGKWLSFGRPDPETGDPAVCSGAFHERYFVLSSNHFRVDGYCDGERIISVESEVIRSTPAFDFGEATISFDSFPDVAVNDDICGDFEEIWLKYEAAENAAVTETIGVYLPYSGSYLHIALAAAIAEPTPSGPLLTEGTYIFDEVSTGLILQSPVFETEESPSDTLLPATGSLTIVYRDEFSVEAQFEFTTSSGEYAQGRFSFSLR